MKDCLYDIFHRYPALTSAALVVMVGLVVFFCSRQHVQEESVLPEDSAVSDTLALNILCSPTMESLPLYHAVESGLCDSLHLSLVIHTATSQFDIDSIMRRTKRIDGAVFDTYRLQYYKSIGKPLPVTKCLPLTGSWKLLTSAKLRLRETSKLKKRPVATARYATSYHLLEEFLRGAGLKTTDLYHAQINDYQTRLEMLDGAQIDACVLPEPYATLAEIQGHRVIASCDSVRSFQLCFRDKSLKDKRKERQIKLLKEVYQNARKELRKQGVHVADSALIKTYGIQSGAIDSIRYKY